MARIDDARAAAREIVDFVLDDPLNVREEMIDFAEERVRKALPPAPDTDRKLARAAALEERLRAIIDWADLALSNRAEFDKHGVKNLAGPVFDAARDILTTAPAEAETAPDIKPIVKGK